MAENLQMRVIAILILFVSILSIFSFSFRDHIPYLSNSDLTEYDDEGNFLKTTDDSINTETTGFLGNLGTLGKLITFQLTDEVHWMVAVIIDGFIILGGYVLLLLIFKR